LSFTHRGEFGQGLGPWDDIAIATDRLGAGIYSILVQPSKVVQPKQTVVIPTINAKLFADFALFGNGTYVAQLNISGVCAGGTTAGGVASTFNGERLVVGQSPAGAILFSDDSGQSWFTQGNAPTNLPWKGVATSKDGNVIVAVESSGDVRISVDAGLTFLRNTDAQFAAWSCVAVSDDGSVIIAGQSDRILLSGVNDGGVRISRDRGGTWFTSVGPAGLGDGRWSGVASSVDGSRLMAVKFNDDKGQPTNEIYTSSDTGRTW